MATVDVVRDAPRVDLAPVDTSVIIPESVKRAAAAAEAFYKPQPDSNTLSTPLQADPSAPPQSVTTVAPAAPQSVTTVAPAAPQSVTTVAPAAPQSVTAPAPDPHEENRFNAMKGRYEQSQRTVGHLQEQLTQMGNELMALRQQIQREPLTPPKKLITEQEEKDYGTEFLGVVKKAAQEELVPLVEGLQNELVTLRQQQAQKAQRDVWASLDQSVPNWREINKSPAFINWLSLRDTYSGNIRRVLLDDAFQAADAPRVLSFFRGFVTDEAATSPAPSATAPAAAPAPARTPAVSLEALAAPGRAQSSPAPAAGEKPVYTSAQIRRFYDDVRRQVYLGREPEKNQIEQAIFAAQREGRVRG